MCSLTAGCPQAKPRHGVIVNSNNSGRTPGGLVDRFYATKPGGLCVLGPLFCNSVRTPGVS